jgi:hypothetical protein
VSEVVGNQAVLVRLVFGDERKAIPPIDVEESSAERSAREINERIHLLDDLFLVLVFDEALDDIGLANPLPIAAHTFARIREMASFRT